MTKHMTSDRDLESLLSGRAPDGEPELAVLAGEIADFRRASFARTAQPSAALAERLGLPVQHGAPIAADISAMADRPSPVHTAEPETASQKTMGRRILEWLAGLGIAAKLTLGSAVAVAATAGVGAAGALPEPAQDAFDTVFSVSEELPEQDVTDQPATGVTDTADDAGDTVEGAIEDVQEEKERAVSEGAEFGAWVSEKAKDADKVGAEFGAEVSERAKQLGGAPDASVDADVDVEGNGSGDATSEVDADVNVKVGKGLGVSAGANANMKAPGANR